MTTRIIIAMFETRPAAYRAAQRLTEDLGHGVVTVRLVPGMRATDDPDANLAGSRYGSDWASDTGLFGALRGLFVSDEERPVYAEGLRRGSSMVFAEVDAGMHAAAATILEDAGALDLDAEAASWLQAGWDGRDPSYASSDRAGGIALVGSGEAVGPDAGMATSSLQPGSPFRTPTLGAADSNLAEGR